jgi:hypothetical protein
MVHMYCKSYLRSPANLSIKSAGQSCAYRRRPYESANRKRKNAFVHTLYLERQRCIPSERRGQIPAYTGSVLCAFSRWIELFPQLQKKLHAVFASTLIQPLLTIYSTISRTFSDLLKWQQGGHETLPSSCI